MVVVLAITNALLGATIVALVGIGTGSAQGLTAVVALGKGTSIYQIVGGAVTVTTHQPGFFSALRIITDGRASCSATIRYFRNAGHPYFEYTNSNNENVMASDFHAENMTCSIAE